MVSSSFNNFPNQIVIKISPGAQQSFFEEDNLRADEIRRIARERSINEHEQQLKSETQKEIEKRDEKWERKKVSFRNIAPVRYVYSTLPLLGLLVLTPARRCFISVEVFHSRKFGTDLVSELTPSIS